MERRVKSGCLTSLEDTVLYWRIQNQICNTTLWIWKTRYLKAVLRINTILMEIPNPQLVLWYLVHPRFGLVTVRPTQLVLVTVELLNFSTHIFLVPVSFSTWIFLPPPGGRWTNCHLWQLVQPPVTVSPPVVRSKIGSNCTRSLVADDSHFFQPILLKMARPLQVNDNLRRKKVGKVTYFLLTMPFSLLFKRK